MEQSYGRYFLTTKSEMPQRRKRDGPPPVIGWLLAVLWLTLAVTELSAAEGVTTADSQVLADLRKRVQEQHDPSAISELSRLPRRIAIPELLNLVRSRDADPDAKALAVRALQELPGLANDYVEDIRVALAGRGAIDALGPFEDLSKIGGRQAITVASLFLFNDEPVKNPEPDVVMPPVRLQAAMALSRMNLGDAPNRKEDFQVHYADVEIWRQWAIANRTVPKELTDRYYEEVEKQKMLAGPPPTESLLQAAEAFRAVEQKPESLFKTANPSATELEEVVNLIDDPVGRSRQDGLLPTVDVLLSFPGSNEVKQEVARRLYLRFSQRLRQGGRDNDLRHRVGLVPALQLSDPAPRLLEDMAYVPRFKWVEGIPDGWATAAMPELGQRGDVGCISRALVELQEPVSIGQLRERVTTADQSTARVILWAMRYSSTENNFDWLLDFVAKTKREKLRTTAVDSLNSMTVLPKANERALPRAEQLKRAHWADVLKERGLSDKEAASGSSRGAPF